MKTISIKNRQGDDITLSQKEVQELFFKIDEINEKLADFENFKINTHCFFYYIQKELKNRYNRSRSAWGYSGGDGYTDEEFLIKTLGDAVYEYEYDDGNSEDE